MTSWQKVSNLPSSGMQRPSVSLRTNVPRHLITVIKSYVCLVLGPIEEKQPPTPYPQSTYDSEHPEYEVFLFWMPPPTTKKKKKV